MADEVQHKQVTRQTSDGAEDRYLGLLAEYSHRTAWENMATETVHEVKRRTLDSIGVAVAAFDKDAPSIARAYAVELTHPDGATLWGLETRVAPEAAAFANGVMVRYLDYNDTYLSLEPLHPSDVLPALMAACQYRQRSVRDFITAAAVAYEVGVSLCDAASIRAHRWDHVMYTSIGAACGVGNLLGLSVPEIANAIAITVVPHAPMRQTRVGELSMWKGAAAARAVSHAVFASLLAEKGLTGPSMPFEGEMGFFRQLLEGGSFDPTALDGIEAGTPPRRILDTYVKKWPVEYHAQSAVDAAIELRDDLDGAAIESVQIETFKTAYEIIAKDPEKWAPRTRETADHSLPYIVAVSLTDGTVTKDSFSEDRLRDPGLAELLGKTTLVEDDELTAGYPKGIPNRVRVTTSGGRSLERSVSFPRGHAMNPMTDSDLEGKFFENVAGRWPGERARRTAGLVWDLENQPDLEGLMEAIQL